MTLKIMLLESELHDGTCHGWSGEVVCVVCGVASNTPVFSWEPNVEPVHLGVLDIPRRV